MRSLVALSAVAFVAGVGAGVAIALPVPHLAIATLVLLLTASLGAVWSRKLTLITVACTVGILHGATAREAALYTSLRDRLGSVVPGASIDDPGMLGPHDPIRLRARLSEDAVDAGEFVSLRLQATALRIGNTWQPVRGGVVVSVNGAVARNRLREWSAGRLIEAPISFRRPARYLDAGVDDFERDAALSGITLFGSVKSVLLVDVVATGNWSDEMSARARRVVRRAAERWVAPYGGVAAAIVTAVLIGDRGGVPEDVRNRLQKAGTYHVIAISGGNIAILAALIVGVLALFGIHGRYVALTTIAVLITYAQVTTAGPSVWRATLMGVLYFGARVFDHRTPPWHAIAVAGAVIATVQPLDVRDAGFLLTFGATGGLLALAHVRLPLLRNWIAASIAASVAAEIVLLPVSATVFSRVTAAGPLLNLLAIPAMAVVQIAGMVVVAGQSLDHVGVPAGWIAAHGALALVESARLVDLMPWLVRRVPVPPLWMVAAYYAALLVAWRPGRVRLRLGACGLFAALAVLIVAGIHPTPSGTSAGVLRLTMIDVGQGESILLQAPGAEPLLIDTGGALFGGGTFDIGTRVLAPALWARGVRQLGELLVTHGDPDHIGGAAGVLADFRPASAWWGIPVPPHVPSRTFLEAAARTSHVDYRRAGDTIGFGRARLRVLNPPAPDWERQRVRNDDSVVVEVTFGDVAILLTGDISATVERTIARQLTPARARVLKVAHHGSRTSTSDALLEAWHPQIALISCGRGNTFGHPAPDVVARLTSIGARVYRTDQDGEITLTSDGRSVSVRTFTGEKR